MPRRTKIIATVGPSCVSLSKLTALVHAGVDIFRINTSHAEPEEIRKWFGRIRSLKQSIHKTMPILVDLQGPRIRTGARKGKKKIKFFDQQQVPIRVSAKPSGGTEITTTCLKFPEMVKIGDPILIDNGLLELRVLKIRDSEILCDVILGGVLGENKGINLPNAPAVLPAISERDREVIDSVVDLDPDYIALSFVRNKKDVQSLREVLDQHHSNVPIIAKIEKPRALDHIPAILAACDGLMVARGDLGIELGVEKVPVIQKKLIWIASRNRVPVITATQMLESMMNHPRPLRAEVSDVANAVFDGTDMVMLSGETAIGSYPVETVQMMVKIIREAESYLQMGKRS